MKKKIVAFDSETFAFSAGQAAPKGVCLTFCVDGAEPTIFKYADGLAVLKGYLLDPDVILVAHNGPYDLAIACIEDPSLLKLVFAAYETGKIRDTLTRAQLIDIANGNFYKTYFDPAGVPHKITYSLAGLVHRYLGRYMQKADTWRTRYGELADVPLAEWPEPAVKYAMDDAIGAYELFMKQCEAYSLDEDEEWPGCVPDENLQTRSQWAFHLLRVWGIRTDPVAVYALRDRLVLEQADLIASLKIAGLIRLDGTKDTKVLSERVEAGLRAAGYVEKDFPRTPTGRLKCDAKTIELAEADPVLDTLGKFSKNQKVLSTYVPALITGTQVPINAEWRNLVESSRAACGEPNLTNQPRGGDVRACFVPRPGNVFIFCDYDTAELRSLAEACMAFVGKSEMAVALRRGEDLHLAFASELMGITYEEISARYQAGDKEVEGMRQFAKAAMFGFPGSLGAETFVSYARGYGLNITLKQSEELKAAWLRRFSEMRAYFAMIGKIVGRSNSGKVESLYSGFVRGNVGYTQAANHFFQAHTATIAKDALWHVVKESYTDSSSALFGSRAVLYIHDELGIESPERKASAAAARLQELMVAVAQKWLKHVPAKASAAMMRRWHKGAKAVYVDGKMVPSKPEKRDGRTTWVHDV